jgi:hypothetical protein
VVRDNLNTHRSQAMRRYTEKHADWVTVVHLPGYAPDLNAVEGAWASMKSGLGNHAATPFDDLETLVRSRLRSIQRRPGLINAFLGQTGLSLRPAATVDPGLSIPVGQRSSPLWCPDQARRLGLPPKAWQARSSCHSERAQLSPGTVAVSFRRRTERASNWATSMTSSSGRACPAALLALTASPRN